MDGDFPREFRVQRIGLAAAKAVVDHPPADIATYFRDHPEDARNLVIESGDKRFTAYSFIDEKDGRFRVGWFSSRCGYECVRQFSDLADAATDYLLFSLGKGRWSPPSN